MVIKILHDLVRLWKSFETGLLNCFSLFATKDSKDNTYLGIFLRDLKLEPAFSTPAFCLFYSMIKAIIAKIIERE